MGSRGSASGVGREVSIYSKAAFQAGNDARDNLIKAINKYNEKLIGAQPGIKKLSDDGETLIFTDNDKVKTTTMLEALGLAPKGYMYSSKTMQTTMRLPKDFIQY